MVTQTLVRETFLGALRLFRTLVVGRPDLQALRQWAARFDRLFGRELPGPRAAVVQFSQCTANWIGAKPRSAATPVLLYLHGGAFILETPRLHGAFAARLARAAGCRALMLNYRLAPEHPFPAAPDDCLEAYRWLLEQGHPGRRIVLAGDSAGGNLGLGLLLRLRELGLALPACSVVLSPLTDATFSGDSVERNEGLDPMFTSRAFGALAPLYLPKGDPRTEPLVSPLFAPLDGLPPVLLLVGSSELLLDDSVRFATRCPSAELQVWHGMPHVFALFDFLPEARRALDGIAAFVRAQLAASGAEGAAESASEPEAAAPEADVTAALARQPAERATRARWRWLWSLALAAIAVFAVLRACADGSMALP